MAKNVVINEINYNNLPFMSAPLAEGGEDAVFWDISDSTINASKIRNGEIGYAADGSRVVGTMTEKAAATFKPTGSDQTVNANQYLKGAQTFQGVVCTNLNAAYIAKDVVVKIGCASDDDSVTSVTGTLQTPVIVQDPTTHGLRIS